MLPSHSRGPAHAPPAPGNLDSCLHHRLTTPPSHVRPETLPVAQSVPSSSGSTTSSNASGSSTRTTIAAAALQLQEADSISSRTPGGSLRSRQRNRLQLRNAGFRAASIQSRRVSPFSIFSTSRETSPSAVVTEQSTRSPYAAAESSILQEIRRSTRRKSRNTRPGLQELFPGQEANLEVPYATSSTSNMSPRMEYLSKAQENDENTPPPSLRSSTRRSSPVGNRIPSFRGSRGSSRGLSSNSHRVGRQRAVSNKHRSSNLQVDAYIDYLEAEIASLETRLSTLNSPSRTSNLTAKLRSMTAENRSLKQQVTDWEKKFDEAVDDSVHDRTRFEADMHRRIRELEEEVRGKDEKSHILELQMRDYERRAKKAEDCEKLMSSRVDLFTSMIASSPGKTNDGWATAPVTPLGNDFPEPLRPTQRVQSAMLPPPRSIKTGRSLSPSRRETITSAEDIFGWHAPDEPSISQVIDELEHQSNEHEDSNSGAEDASMYSTSQSGQQSVISASTQPTSIRSADIRSPSHRERPISMLSTSSFSASWGLPPSLTRSNTDGPGSSSLLEPGSKQAPQAKRMRRFHSSAGGLKPLILPSTASTSSNSLASPRRMSFLSPTRLVSVSETHISDSYPQSAPVNSLGTGHLNAPYRATSGGSQLTQSSFDPTTAFFDSSRESTPLESSETPTLAARRRSKEMRARELERMKALRQLEGDFTGSIDQMIAEISNRQAGNRDTNLSDDDTRFEEDLLGGTPGSTLDIELRDARIVSSGTILTPSPSHKRRVGSAYSNCGSTSGWAEGLLSTPSTPARSRSPSFVETPKAPEAPDDSRAQAPILNDADGATFYSLTSTAIEGPILQPPRISIHAGTVSDASCESITSEAPASLSQNNVVDGLFERLTRLATRVLPFRKDRSTDTMETARSTLNNSRPVLLARRILERSWDRTSEKMLMLSPFRLGGLGWWLFGLLNQRARNGRNSEFGYPVLTSDIAAPEHTDADRHVSNHRPRQISCSTEEREIGIPANPDTHDFTPSQLRKLELDGPGECFMQRAEPPMLFDEHSAMLGLPQFDSVPHHRNYGSIPSTHLSRDVEVRANSAVDRAFGRSHMACTYCKEPKARRRLRAWAKFGLALVLAVGVALLEGPEAVMGDTAEGMHDATCSRSKRDSEDYRDDIEDLGNAGEGGHDERRRLTLWHQHNRH